MSQKILRTSAYKRTTDKQYSLLTREMAKYTVNSHNGKSKHDSVYWADLTGRLNVLGPPYRNVSQWKKVWTDFRRFHSKRDFKSQPKFKKNIKKEREPIVENEYYPDEVVETQYKSRPESPGDNEIMNFEEDSLTMHSTYSNDYTEPYSYTEKTSHHPHPSSLQSHELEETLIPDEEPSFACSSYYAEADQERPKRSTTAPTASITSQQHHQPTNTNLMDQTLYTLQNQMEHQTKLLEHLSQITSSVASLMERQVAATEKQTEAIRRQASATEHHTLVMNSFVEMIREKMPKASNIKMATTNLANGDL